MRCVRPSLTTPRQLVSVCGRGASQDQRSTVLAVDNFNGAKVLGRTIRCDHCQDYHEEQAKDPANLPDHVTRKLSEKELDKKRREVEDRNAELEEATASKEGLFAVGRGTYEGESQRDERQIRISITQVTSRLGPAPGPACCD